MTIPQRQYTPDQQSMEEDTALRYGTIWGDGAACAANARQDLRAFLGHAPRTGFPSTPPTLAMDAELAASELVTNAVRHAPGPCGMTLQLSREELTITVWDSSTDEPAVKPADPRRIGGHGLRLVHTVSDRVVVALRATGKRITAHLPLAPNPTTSVLGGTAVPA
ncbi:ATP-binding protein [Streptomyces phaeoluteigriseus]|uniref:ATP-binding protein n=1 Tax=Streptomyces phaeoluteigriseus TaxID=114686 RepID=A0ABY4Z8Y9_9ACTN|nr:ATP-binding protein [Streptomyces phaeoluteigriseus]USQ85416.1 ATP-binding protein [Streptomyces phaeoluteigriseus]